MFMFLNLSPEAKSVLQSKKALEFGKEVHGTVIGPAKRQVVTRT